jgi:hypothetical protein
MYASSGDREFHEHAGPISVITITCSLTVVAFTWITTSYISYPLLLIALTFFSLALSIVTARELMAWSKVKQAQDTTGVLGGIRAVWDQQPQEATIVQGEI